MTIRGIDISRWQGTINWTALKNEVDFVFMKATEGTSYIDPQFHRNLQACRTAKIPHGLYHYVDVADPIKEADHFINTCKRVNGEGQSLDFEGNILNSHSPVAWAKSWLDHVHSKTGNRPIPYMSGSTTGRFDWSAVVKENYGLWDASWGSSSPNPDHWPFWAFWQTADNGHMQGIGGAVDLDQFRGSLADLAKYFSNDGTVAKPPAVKPTPPASKPKPTEQPIAGYYTVRGGDTLTAVAHRYGTSVGELSRLNKITNVNLIKVGERLRVAGAAPAAPKPSHPSHGPTGYVVRAGDTMTGIASKHGESLASLKLKNPQVHNANLIFAGEHIFV